MRKEYSTGYTGYPNARGRIFYGAEAKRMMSLIVDHGDLLLLIIDDNTGHYSMYIPNRAMDRVYLTKQEAEYAERVLDLISERG